MLPRERFFPLLGWTISGNADPNLHMRKELPELFRTRHVQSSYWSAAKHTGSFADVFVQYLPVRLCGWSQPHFAWTDFPWQPTLLRDSPYTVGSHSVSRYAGHAWQNCFLERLTEVHNWNNLACAANPL